MRDIVRTEQCNGCHDRSKPMAERGATSGSVSPATRRTSPISRPVRRPSRSIPIPATTSGSRSSSTRSTGARACRASKPVRRTRSSGSGSPWPTSRCRVPAGHSQLRKCHAGGSQSHAFATKPSRQACGSCHDDVNFASGENHGGGPQPNDGSCSSCHLPETGKEFDLSVVGSHTIPAHSSQAPGVRFELIGVQSVETGNAIVAPGEHPLVTFRITDGSARRSRRAR